MSKRMLVERNNFKEECGIIGIYQSDDEKIADNIYGGLMSLQHRGQESAGIATSNIGDIKCYKGLGLVNQVFNDKNLSQLIGNIGVGHVRYSTFGSLNSLNAQPLVEKKENLCFSYVHNGNILNANSLRKQLLYSGVTFETDVDSEIIGKYISLKYKGNIEDTLVRMVREIKGAYSIVLMTENKLIGIRDELGYRPLVLGMLNNGYVLASETCALDKIGASYIRDIAPGEIVVIDKNGIKVNKVSTNKRKSFCVFEYIYFSSPNSCLEGVRISNIRNETGRLLAKEHPVEADMVAPIPKSGIHAAKGYASEANMLYKEILIKSSSIGRTFILPTQKNREYAVASKFTLTGSDVFGKKVILVDDSLVRGTTIKNIAQKLRSLGAKEVHVRISSPPIKFPCYFGVNISDSRELIASKKSVKEIETIIGVNSLRYLDYNSLILSIGKKEQSLCTACLNGIYANGMMD